LYRCRSISEDKRFRFFSKLLIVKVNRISSSNIVMLIKTRRMGRAGHVARTGDMRNAYKVLGGRPEVRRPLGRSRRRWEDNVRLYLRVVGWGSYGGLDSSGSGWRPVAGCCEHGNEPSGSIKGMEFLDQLSDY
jgi:hypothetical protein